MLPLSQTTTKRKAAEDSLSATKKAKKETKIKSGKRKLLNGEEQPGGLVIVRGSVAGRPVAPKPPAEPAELEEDVRQMQSETEDLRQRSRAHSNGLASSPLKPDFKLPSSSKSSKSSRPTPHSKTKDTSKMIPAPSFDSPHIEKNRQLRGQAMNHSRRRSSISSRGKRISSSYESTGVISQPHNSVSNSSFHKHIDCDLPEPARLRQLLVWCASRIMNKHPETPHASTSKQHLNVDQDEESPPLTPEDEAILKLAEEDVIQMLVEQKIQMKCYQGSLIDALPKALKENEQNVLNRQRDITFSAHIQRAKVEEDQWVETERHYNSRLADLAKLGEIASPSSKSKGKQRAAPKEQPDFRRLSEDFQKGATTAQELLSAPSDASSSRSRIQDSQVKIDEMYSVVHSGVKSTEVAESDIDRRFAILSRSLGTRSQLKLPSTYDSSSIPAPTSLIPKPPDRVANSGDLFRALSRADAARPPVRIGDAAHRAAREVKRLGGGGSVPERRLTGVPPPTPRKLPGTPRRGTSPGR